MYETYGLYLENDEGKATFVPLTCAPRELMARAKEEMAKAKARAAQIEQFGRPLFALGAEPSP